MIVDLITIGLVFLAAMANIGMDLSSEGYFKRCWWNKKCSWRRKYKLGDPELGPAFFLSTTMLVFVTDGWHLMQFIFLNSMLGAIAINTFDPLFVFIVLRVLFSGVFELGYSYLKNNK